MSESISTDNPALDALFERYRQAPNSHVFAPLADACRKAGMISEAIEIVEKGIAANPDYPSGFVVRGKCYFDRGDVGEAEKSFKRVLELDPNNLVALKHLGMILADRGDTDGAREHFKQILVLDPDDRRIRESLEALPESQSGSSRPGAAADSGGDFEGAEMHLGDPEDSASDELATTTLADIYAAQGYKDKAVRIYREVLAGQPENEEVREKIRAIEAELVPAGERKAGEDTVIQLPADEDVTFEEVPTGDEKKRPVSRHSADNRRPTITLGPPPEESPARARRNPIDEGRSYEQFKRWLKNIAD